MTEQGFQCLVRGHYIIEAHQRHSVHHTGVVCVKRNQVAHAYIPQGLQHESAVQGFPVSAAMLTAAIQHGHDDIQPVSLAARGLDQTKQILEMIVGGHGVRLSEQIVLNAVVAHVDDKVQVHTTYGGFDQTFGIAGRKTGAFRFNNERVFFDAGLFGPFDQVGINTAGQFFGAFRSDNTQGSCAILAEKQLRFSRSHVY